MESARAEHDKNDSATESFWRTPRRAVPGRPRQTVERNEVMSGSSYQQFQASVNDAWDLGDDDVVSGIADAKISRAAAQTAALSVINSHRNNAQSAVRADGAGKEDGAGAGSALRRYPGRPRPVRLSALSSREESSESKLERFTQLLDSAVLDLDELKQLSWSGIPTKVSPIHREL